MKLPRGSSWMYMAATIVVVVSYCVLFAQARKLQVHTPKITLPNLKAREVFDPKRVHFVDRVGNNGLFRGNEPIAKGDDTFSYDTVVAEIRKKALQEANWVLPDQFYMIDLSFESIEEHDITAELQYWMKYPERGYYLKWSLFGAPFSPSSIKKASIREYIAEHIWVLDKLPERLSNLRQSLETWNNGTLIVYGHCEAGCDRTGEFMGSYLMQYKNKTIMESWESDTSSCGREPYHVSEYAMQWYCEHLKDQGYELNNCTIER